LVDAVLKSKPWNSRTQARLTKLTVGLEQHAARAVDILVAIKGHLPNVTRAEAQYHSELRGLEQQTRRWNQAAMVLNTKVQALEAHAQSSNGVAAESGLVLTPDNEAAVYELLDGMRIMLKESKENLSEASLFSSAGNLQTAFESPRR